MNMTNFAFLRLFLQTLLFTRAASVDNLALHKPAVMFSTSDAPQTNLEAGNAVDGNMDGDWNNGSCSQTSLTSQNIAQWWMVDLLKTYTITSVHILYRQDKLTKNFGNFVIETFWSNPTVFPDSKSDLCFYYEQDRFPGDNTVTCTKPVIGRFLRIRKILPSPYKTLTLCEVMVYGSPNKDDKTSFRNTDLKMVSRERLEAADTATYENKTKLQCAGTCASDERCQGLNHNHLTSTCVLVFLTWDTDPSTPDVNWTLYGV